LWWIAVLAAAGTCRALTAALLREAGSARWPDWARRASVTALTVLGDDEELRPLLDLDHDEDPDDEILSAVIAGGTWLAANRTDRGKAAAQPAASGVMGTGGASPAPLTASRTLANT
jgi:hypothetical protein